ncbi:MAG: hypothetical protein ACW99A_18695, partial [Candidatus Kariarchaeaceae archaeon]
EVIRFEEILHMTNLLQDLSILIYDKLFFGLSFGNYNLCVSTEFCLVTVFLSNREAFDNDKI